MWVLPTFGRPVICQRALDSIIACGCSTPGVVVVDGDPDPRYRGMTLPPGWRLVTHSENRGFLPTLNWAFETYACEPWYGLLNDDFVMWTPGWDVRLVEAAGACGLANSNDLWQAGQPAPDNPRGRMCGALVFGGDLLRALGWWCPPGLFHCFADDAWEAIAARLGNRRYLREVIVEHRHSENGKAERDATYRHNYSRLEADRRIWTEFARDSLPAALERAASTCGIDLARLPAPEASRSPAILSMTASDPPGYVEIPGVGGSAAFAISVVNLGAGGKVTVSADTGAAVPLASIAMCETDPSTGACRASPAGRVSTTIAAGATATFAVFMTASGAIADAPGVNRVYVSFTDAADKVCGETSIAVRTRS